MQKHVMSDSALTHWGRVTHICVSKLTIIGSDNGLSPDRRQAIIWNNAGLLVIGPLGTNFSEIFIEILTFSFKKIPLKVSSAKRRPFCLGLNVLTALDCTSNIVNKNIQGSEKITILYRLGWWPLSADYTLTPHWIQFERQMLTAVYPSSVPWFVKMSNGVSCDAVCITSHQYDILAVVAHMALCRQQTTPPFRGN